MHPFNRGAWTEPETSRLIQLVDLIGKKWFVIQSHINRHSDACRDKYREIEGGYYRRGKWDPSEEKQLEKLVRASLGEQHKSADLSTIAQELEDKTITISWTTISKQMKHRSRLACHQKFSNMSTTDNGTSRRHIARAARDSKKQRMDTTILNLMSAAKESTKVSSSEAEQLPMPADQKAGIAEEMPVNRGMPTYNKNCIVNFHQVLESDNVTRDRSCSLGSWSSTNLRHDEYVRLQPTGQDSPRKQEGTACTSTTRGAGTVANRTRSEFVDSFVFSMDDIFPCDATVGDKEHPRSSQLAPGSGDSPMTCQPPMMARGDWKRGTSQFERLLEMVAYERGER
jgi:Myb-like DNA-binding domain